MTETRGPAYLIVAESDADLGSDFHVDAQAAATIVQQAGEGTGSLLRRVQRGARVLGESGCRIGGARLLLGPHDPARQADRLELARGLVSLLEPDSTLQLTMGSDPDDQLRLFELVGWLLADGRGTPRVQLIFREPSAAARPPQSGPRSATEVLGTFDLTG